MPSATKLLTWEEFSRMPDDGYRYELVRGELRRMSRPGRKHGLVEARVTAKLLLYADQYELGEVLAGDSGFVVAEDPDTVRGPDVAFVRKERLGTGIPAVYWRGAPDLAVEVRSPDDRAGEIAEKIREYLTSGARLVWLLDPRSRTLTVHRPGEKPRTLRADETIDGEDVLPGFSCPIAWFFRDI